MSRKKISLDDQLVKEFMSKQEIKIGDRWQYYKEGSNKSFANMLTINKVNNYKRIMPVIIEPIIAEKKITGVSR